MNRDKIRENTTLLFNIANQATVDTEANDSVKQAYQSAISELQSDVAVMRKITGKEKWVHGANYMMYNLKDGLFWGVVYNSKTGLFTCLNLVATASQFTHYLQIELED